MSLRELLKEKREEILSIATKYGAFNVRIFGSVARGEETAIAMWIFWWNWNRVETCWIE
jgi:predicted nucleotidyltransferase